MKKTYTFLLIASFVGFSSCGLISDLIPDVETEFSQTYTVRVGDNSNATEPEVVDVKSSPEYEDFKDNIDGFTIDDIVFQILNYNAPDDLYFEGDIVASIEGETPVTAGTFNRILLSSVAETGEEYQVVQYVENIQQLVDWMDSPGEFTAHLTYNLTDAMGNPYNTEGMNYNFQVKVIYKVTVETGVK
jgi:hypothetical protein